MPPAIAPSSPRRRPRAPSWPEWLASVAYLADKLVWTAQETAHVALLQVIAPDHIRETLEALQYRPRRGDRLFAPPSESERELAKCYGVTPIVWQVFEDEQHPPGLERRGARQGGRKRKKKPHIRWFDPLKRWKT